MIVLLAKQEVVGYLSPRSANLVLLRRRRTGDGRGSGKTVLELDLSTLHFRRGSPFLSAFLHGCLKLNQFPGTKGDHERVLAKQGLLSGPILKGLKRCLHKCFVPLRRRNRLVLAQRACL